MNREEVFAHYGKTCPKENGFGYGLWPREKAMENLKELPEFLQSDPGNGNGRNAESSRYGDSTADLAAKLADRDTLGRIRAVETRLVVMRQDRDDIERALREVHRVHKTILICHYVKGHTWTATAIQAGYSPSHTRRLKSRALEMLGHSLDEGPMPGELVARARDAHI